MITENSLLECDVIKSFMKNYDFPIALKIKNIITDDI